MKKYLFCICFISFLTAAFGLILTVQKIDNLVFPSMTQTELSALTLYDYYPSLSASASTKAYQKSLDERKKTYQQTIDNKRKKGVVDSSAIVLISLGIFIFHWKRLSYLNKTEDESELINIKANIDE